MLVFVAAFAMMMAVDKVIAARGTRYEARGARHAARGTRHEAQEGQPSLAPRASRLAAYATAFLMFGAALAAPALKPVPAEGPALDLERLVPQAFGDWSIDPTVVPIPPAADVQAKLDRIYNATLSRAYVNPQGEQMMLTLAYGGDQSDALKAHRQEVCYTAQGFTIHGLEQGELKAQGRDIPVTRMLAVRGDRSEPVTYWFTMGERVVRGRFERLHVQLASGLAGRVPDGMLVRVSSLSKDPEAAYAAQRSFVAALLAATPPADAARIAGAARS
jgi:EpsI family protein